MMGIWHMIMEMMLLKDIKIDTSILPEIRTERAQKLIAYKDLKTISCSKRVKPRM